jgi:signal transduction histidine kinase
LQEDYGHLLDDAGLQFLADIREDAAAMAEIVDGLYRVSKVRTMQGLPLEPVDLNEMLADMLVSTTKRGLLRPQDRLTWDLLPLVKADKVLLTEVFRNFIENALKFNESEVKTIHVSAQTRPDGRWDISVKDNGIGIDPKYQPKVFQMFQRMHPAYKGTGVGLALVAAIVQKLSGDVRLESAVDQGCTFTFDLAAGE